MTLENIPIVSREVLIAYGHRLRSPEEFNGFFEEMEQYLRTQNPSLYATIEGQVGRASDPLEEFRVRNGAYAVLALINDQINFQKVIDNNKD